MDCYTYYRENRALKKIGEGRRAEVLKKEDKGEGGRDKTGRMQWNGKGSWCRQGGGRNNSNVVQKERGKSAKGEKTADSIGG